MDWFMGVGILVIVSTVGSKFSKILTGLHLSLFALFFPVVFNLSGLSSVATPGKKKYFLTMPAKMSPQWNIVSNQPSLGYLSTQAVWPVSGI